LNQNQEPNPSAQKKLGFIPPLMITADWITYGGSWNKAMVLFEEIILFALEPKTQCIG
jgi:hypothetical protein